MNKYMSKVFKPVAADKIDVIADLLIKLVGETIHGKLLRAILVGLITAGSQYSKDVPDAPIPSVPATASQSPAIK